MTQPSQPPQLNPAQPGQSYFAQPPQRISVVDFDMPFSRMVIFMIKWAFAAIPAVIVIWAVMLAFFLAVVVFFGGIAALSGHQ